MHHKLYRHTVNQFLFYSARNIFKVCESCLVITIIINIFCHEPILKSIWNFIFKILNYNLMITKVSHGKPQIISGQLQNKSIANKSWFTVIIVTNYIKSMICYKLIKSDTQHIFKTTFDAPLHLLIFFILARAVLTKPWTWHL